MHLYQEYPPHPLLAAHVACLWTSRALPDGAPVRTRVLPDNCIDILWQDRAPLGFVAGMMSRAHRVEMAQPVLSVAVRFLPGAARAFFDVPLHLLQDAHPGLDDLWPRFDAEALAAALWEREHPIEHRLATLERALLARLHARTHARTSAPARADTLVRTAINLLEKNGGALRVEDLASRLQVSRQHLALQFRERVGLSAKTFAMVCQFRHAHAVLRSHGAGEIDWPRLAGDCGYYDQSHLIHAFRQFADDTPASFHFSNTRP
jgi:methylphosphotriester-DNA--protein-cysteine methyltransferase